MTGGGLLGRVRKRPPGIIGAALVLCLGGFFDSALAEIAPSGADAHCAPLQADTNNRPLADAPKSSDRLTILIATIDHDDTDHTYTRAVARAFLNRDGVKRIETCPVLLLSGIGRQANAADTARDWLRQRHAELLIGGELLEKDKEVNLWFVGNDSGQVFQSAPFRFDANLLKEDFKQATSTQLLAIGLAAVEPVTEESGKYLAGILRPVIERMRRLLDDSAGFSEEQRAQLRHVLGLGLLAAGERGGDKHALDNAAAAFRAMLKEYTRERMPFEWAETQTNFGNALSALGEHESGTVGSEGAVAAYREALKERTRERVPLAWAMLQNNLGAVLMRLGERESSTAHLEEAVLAFRAALQERTRSRAPLDWARTQNNLGIALQRLGERESSTARLEEAVAAFGAALQERTRERVPLEWAAAQNNFGDALRALGERESGTARLDEAVVVFRAALQERTRERVPLEWAMTQNNLGNALSALGDRESGTARQEEAVVAYRAALGEWTRERVPHYWASTQENLAITFGILATRTSGDVRGGYLADALKAVDDALEVYRDGNAAYDIGTAERLRARIMAALQQTPAPPR